MSIEYGIAWALADQPPEAVMSLGEVGFWSLVLLVGFWAVGRL